MSFAYPLVLLTLLIPAYLLVRTWRRRGRELVVPFDHGRQPSGRVLRVLMTLAESLPALVLAVAILILAGPQARRYPQEQTGYDEYRVLCRHFRKHDGWNGRRIAV